MASPGSRGGKGWKAPVYHKPKSSAKSSSYKPSGRKKSSGKKKGGGGGGGYNPMAAERRAIARENKAKAKAAARYRAQAATLKLQADALKKALGSEGFEKALKTRLAGIKLVFSQQDQTIMEGYNERTKGIDKAGADNEAAAADNTYANLQNRARERQSAVSAALLHGAGESDVLKAQLMSLRSYQSNQGETARSYFDSLTSINSSLNDLNVDTKTARLNAETEFHADEDQLWTQYYNQKSEAYTQLGNVQGQIAEAYGLANEQKSGSSGDQKKYSKESGKTFLTAAEYTGKAYKNPGNSAALREWKGQAARQGVNNAGRLHETSGAIPAPKKPEGATLREWETA